MTTLLLKLFVKDYQQTRDPAVRRRYGTLGGICGILLNLLLFGAKCVAGLLTASISIVADAFNNLSDAGSSVITLVGFKLAGKKRDKEHPFGHGRLEYIAGLVISFIIILVGFELFTSSIEKIITPSPVQFHIVSVCILIGSILIKLWMGLFNRNLGRRIDSAALRVAATDSLSDVAATAAVLVGLLVSRFAGLNIDGYIGVLVAGFIMFGGIKSARDTINPLLGQAPDPAFVRAVQQTVLSHPEIIGLHDMIVHNYGPGRVMISLHAEIPGDLDIMRAHDTIDLIEMELKQKFGCEATIHMDPLAVDDGQTAALREQVEKLVGEIDPRLRIHDFRITSGPTHTNVIFDVVIPAKFSMTDQDLIRQLKMRIHDLNETYFAVIQVDQDYDGV